MNAAVILIIGIVILALGYVFYGGWLSKQWGIDPSRSTPAHELEDGMDYCPAKAPVLMGHHFSSIAGAGPINGPIQAAVFGWVPVLLWVLIGGIFFGGVHDYGALFASVRNNGQSIGTVVETSISKKAKRLFLIFSYLTLILVVAAFASIVANTFKATYVDGVVDVAASAANATTAIISLLFIVLAIFFGFFVYRRNAPIGVSTVIGVVVIALVMWLGIKWHPIYLSYQTWMIICGIYILVASVTPVWILLQPRDYLSSFLLYAMMILAIIGVIGCHPTLDMPAFTGFKDTIAPTGSSLGYMFPALFVTIACGAISGFHSLVGSGTTAKQLNNEKDAQPIAYGGMLIECVLAIVSLCAVAYIWKDYQAGTTVTPTVVFATGLSQMLGKIFGSGAVSVTYTLMVLAVSVFCLTSLDTATRLARYMFQEFWLKPGVLLPDDLHDPRDADVSGVHHQVPDHCHHRRRHRPCLVLHPRDPGHPACHPCHRPRHRGRQGARSAGQGEEGCLIRHQPAKTEQPKRRALCLGRVLFLRFPGQVSAGTHHFLLQTTGKHGIL